MIYGGIIAKLLRQAEGRVTSSGRTNIARFWELELGQTGIECIYSMAAHVRN